MKEKNNKSTNNLIFHKIPAFRIEKIFPQTLKEKQNGQVSLIVFPSQRGRVLSPNIFLLISFLSHSGLGYCYLESLLWEYTIARILISINMCYFEL